MDKHKILSFLKVNMKETIKREIRYNGGRILFEDEKTLKAYFSNHDAADIFLLVTEQYHQKAVLNGTDLLIVKFENRNQGN
jgi:hypothetical protein